jgi:hypothetical protein
MHRPGIPPPRHRQQRHRYGADRVHPRWRRPGYYITPELQEVLSASELKPDAALRALALRALDQATTLESELTDVDNWGEAADADEWKSKTLRLSELIRGMK